MFRIRAFVLAVSALCLCSAARADDAEDKAVAFVKNQGGEVTRDEKAPGEPVIEVSLSSTQVTDAGLKELAPLKNLTTLNLNFTQLTGAGLKELAPLKNLTTLYLGRTQVTDAGLLSLREAGLLHALGSASGKDEKRPTKSEEVTTLSLGGTRVTDAGLKELAPQSRKRDGNSRICAGKAKSPAAGTAHSVPRTKA